MTAIATRIFGTITIFASLAVTGLYGQADWPTYSHDAAGQRYSPLAQINAKNVSKLKLAVRHRSRLH